jgi:hypothetical protein
MAALVLGSLVPSIPCKSLIIEPVSLIVLETTWTKLLLAPPFAWGWPSAGFPSGGAIPPGGDFPSGGDLPSGGDFPSGG